MVKIKHKYHTRTPCSKTAARKVKMDFVHDECNGGDHKRSTLMIAVNGAHESLYARFTVSEFPFHFVSVQL